MTSGKDKPLERSISLLLVGITMLGLGASDPAGLVIDQEGKGIPGVSVWSIGRSWAQPESSAQATTDSAGRFVLPGAWKLGTQELSYVGLFARAPDGRCGWAASIWRNQPSSADVNLTLSDVGDVSGQLVDQDGKPIAGTDVTIDSLDRFPRKPGQYDVIRLPTGTAKLYAARSGDDGRFVLRGIPRGARIQAVVASPAFGAPTVSWDTTKPVTIALDRRLGSIRGRIMPPGGQLPAGTIKIGLGRELASRRASPGAFQIDLSRTVTVDKDGTFRFSELPPGRYVLTPEFGPDAPYSAKPVQPQALAPGASIPNLEVPLERIPIISGRVIDETTGQGIAGVSLRAYRLLRGNSLAYGNQATTDRSGSYRIAVATGTVMIQPDDPPRTHMGMASESCPRFEVKADRSWPDLKLSRAVSIDGMAVDAAGASVSGAEVRLVVPDVKGFFNDAPMVTTHADGSFRLEQLDPDDRVPVRARTRDAATDGAIVIRTKEQREKGKLIIMLDPKFACRVQGRAVDQRGKPIANVSATLWWSRQLVSEKMMKGMGYGSALDSLKTDQDGRFVSQALWPGDRYKVSFESKVFAKAETPETTGTAGQVHDFGTISLIETSAHIAGRAVDSNGNPVADARVFNRGDGPNPVTATTASDGSFRLEDLYSGARFAYARRDGYRFARLADALRIAQRKFVFVRKEGYRFTGAAVEGDTDDLTVRLLRSSEKPDAWKPRDSAPYEEQMAFAKRTLVRLWDRYGQNAGNNSAWTYISQMATIDPQLALKWSADQGNRFDADVHLATARVLAESDAPAALKLLVQENGRTSQVLLLELAERFMATDQGKARLFAEEAAARGRTLAEPFRTQTQAQAGSVLTRTGKPETGRKLIAEAAEAAAKMGTTDQPGYTRGIAARALAPIDFERALALLEPIKERRDKDRYTGFIIEAIAGSNPERALALVDSLDPNTSMPQTLKTEIAYAIAPARPDQAVRIVEGMTEGHGAQKHQAEAFGWLAVAIAPRDKARACTLIDRALALPIDKPEPFGSYTYFGGALASSAGIALNARRIGYPDMNGALMWVMAARPDGRSGFSDPAMQTLSATIATPLVALLDPAAAETILGQIEARSGLSPSELAGIAGENWLTAWALVDLKHAEGLVDAELNAPERTKAANLGPSGLLRMIEALVTPPSGREEYLREKIGAAWRPGFGH